MVMVSVTLKKTSTMTAFTTRKIAKAYKDRKDLSARLDPQVQLDPRALKVPKDLQAHRESLAGISTKMVSVTRTKTSTATATLIQTTAAHSFKTHSSVARQAACVEAWA